MKNHRLVLLAVLFLAGSSVGAAAQSCLGFPSRDGDLLVAGAYGLTADGGSEVGGEFHADVSGPGAFGFAYRTGLGDTETATYEVRGSYDLYLLEPAICLVAGVRYVDLSSGTTSERLGVPIGIGIGKTMDAGGLATTVYAIPQYMWMREVRTDVLGSELVETSNQFVGEAGVTVGLLPLFVNGALALSTADDEPSFRIRIGLLF